MDDNYRLQDKQPKNPTNFWDAVQTIALCAMVVLLVMTFKGVFS